MAYKMQKLNVVRMAETEEQKVRLEAQDFKEVAEVKANYSDYNITDLKAIAKEKAIEGYYNMKKEDLIKSLTELDNKADAAQEQGDKA